MFSLALFLFAVALAIFAVIFSGVVLFLAPDPRDEEE